MTKKVVDQSFQQVTATRTIKENIILEIVDDEEVQGEVDQIEADEEVARMYKDAKEHHRKIMTCGFK